MFALMSPRKLSVTLSILGFVAIVIFIGLRYQVGPDWVQYYDIHSELSHEKIDTVFSNREPLSYGIFWLSAHLGAEVYLSNIVISSIILFGVFSFARQCYNPWLAIVAAMPYFILIVGMSGVRQLAAAGVLLIMLARYDRLSVWKQIAYVFIAALFHTSAIVGLIYVSYRLRTRLVLKIFATLIILALAYFVTSNTVFFSQSIENYQDRYISDSDHRQSFGALFHLAMVFVPAIAAWLFRRRILPYIHDPTLLQFGIVGTLGIFSLYFIDLFNSTLPSRLTIYFYFVPMMIYPAFTMILGRSGRTLMIYLLVLVHFLILIVWMKFANHSHAYLPYDNILW